MIDDEKNKTLQKSTGSKTKVRNQQAVAPNDTYSKNSRIPTRQMPECDPFVPRHFFQARKRPRLEEGNWIGRDGDGHSYFFGEWKGTFKCGVVNQRQGFWAGGVGGGNKDSC